MKRWLILCGALLFVWACIMVSVKPTGADTNRYCANPRVNTQGTSNADITVDNTAGGVVVLAQNPQRCSALIKNVTNPIRCGPSTGAGAMTVTSTAGFLLNAGEGIGFGIEDGATEAWKCIRTTASSSTVSVIEGNIQ